MYLKSLELQGFKSFPDKTTLYFDEGATVIVGPNGSGKSNITDAMRWVLGELSTKQIRGTKMEDVIFVGTEYRKPMSYAQVSVTFDNSSEDGRLNSPYDTITVTRRFYRAGQSDYFINQNPVRLRDIYELFMNTGVGREGYSIIGQGRIAEIISKKSEDRRNIFEEAAGISKFRYQKDETERKLKQTEENVERTTDIFVELESRVGPLEKESEKAKKYIELYDQKKVADVSLWIYDTQKMRSDIEKYKNDYQMTSNELDMAQDSLNQIEKQEADLYEKSQELKRTIENIYAQIRSCEGTKAELDSELKLIENNVSHAQISSGAQLEQLEKLNAKKAILEDEISKKDGKMAQTNEELEKNKQFGEQIKKELQELSEKRDSLTKTLDDLLNEQRAWEQKKEEAKLKISFIEQSKATENQRKDGLATDIQKYQSELDGLIAQMEEKGKVLSDYEAKSKKIEERLNELSTEIETKTARYDELKEQMNEQNSKRLALFERINALKRMEELFEGYAKSVSFVMTSYQNGLIENAGKIYGPVSTLLQVKKEYITAIEVALGNGLQHIVVDNEQTAKTCIYYLKNNNAGRATFYPVSSVTEQGATAEMKEAPKYQGYIGVASEIITFEPVFKQIFGSLLGRTLVFDNIDNANIYAKDQQYRVKIVTLDGQIINAGGSFTGGSYKHDGNVISRSNDIKEMELDSKNQEKELENIKAEGQKLGESLRNLTSEKSEENKQFNLYDTLYRSEKTEYETIVAQIQVKKELIAGLRSDNEQIDGDHIKNESDLHTLNELIQTAEAKSKEISEKRNELDSDRYEILDSIEEREQKAQENLIKDAEIRKDIENAITSFLEEKNRLNETETEIAQLKQKMSSLQSEVANSSSKTQENRKLFAEADERLKSLEKDREKYSASDEEMEKKRNELSAKSKEISAKKENIVRSNTLNETKLEQLNNDFAKMVSKLYEDYGLSYSSAVELGYPEVTEKNRKEVYAVASDCRQKIRALGSVNTNAIDEYKEVKERYDYLKSQLDDLAKSKKELSSIIADLEVDMKKSFISSFNAINENFNHVFRELFGGGNAELGLTDENDVLNCGIEIKVAPPGKKIESLTLLSGGEQAFVAIALLFAILKANPSPFCIFDEIEAALDDINIKKFSQYIKRYSGQTQFIVITHRRGTMEIADRLYGVTMPQKGISKVITMNVNEVGKEEINLQEGN